MNHPVYGASVPQTRQETEHQRLVRQLTQEYRRDPQKAATAIRQVHQCPNSMPSSRYAIAEAIRLSLLDSEPTSAATLHMACMADLPEVLLAIVMDPRVYMWHDEASSFYHPRLGVSSYSPLLPLRHRILILSRISDTQ